MDNRQLFQELPGLPAAQVQVLDLEHQGQGVKVIHELIVDSAIQIPGPAVLLGELIQGAIIAGRLVGEFGGAVLARVTVDLGPAQRPRYEFPEVFVFFSGLPAPLVMESASQASRMATFTLLGSLSFVSRVQGTSSPVVGSLTSFQSTTM